MTTSGDIEMFSAALGHPVEHKSVLDAMALVGLPTERTQYTEGKQVTTYYVAQGSSVEFVFENGSLDSVIVNTVTDEEHDAYAGSDELIDGLAGAATRAEVRAKFGEPETTKPIFDRFMLDGFTLRFRYKNEVVNDVTVMATTP